MPVKLTFLITTCYSDDNKINYKITNLPRQQRGNTVSFWWHKSFKYRTWIRVQYTITSTLHSCDKHKRRCGKGPPPNFSLSYYLT